MMTPRSPPSSGSSLVISAAASLIMLNEPIKLIRMTRSKSARPWGPSRPTTRLATPMPAQFTSTRAGPCAFAAAITAASPDAASATSQVTATPPISLASSSPNLALRSSTATFAPCAASFRAVAAPNPDAPPVTMAAWPFSCMTSSWYQFFSKRNDLWWRRRRVELLDQARAMFQHRALVDRALVGDLAFVNRQRRIEQHRAGDARRRTGGSGGKCLQPLGKFAAHDGIGRRRRKIARRQRRIDHAAAVKIEHRQGREFIAVDAGDHHIAEQRRADRDKARAQRADADPGAAGELEIFRDAAVEVEAGMPVVGIGRLDGVAELVEALFIERRPRQFRLAPVTGRHIRPLGANLQLAVIWNELGVVARNRQADMAGAAGGRLHRHEERRGFGGP